MNEGRATGRAVAATNGCITADQKLASDYSNLRVEVNWLRRLTGGTEPARELVERLMFDGSRLLAAG